MLVTCHAATLAEGCLDFGFWVGDLLYDYLFVKALLVCSVWLKKRM